MKERIPAILCVIGGLIYFVLALTEKDPTLGRLDIITGVLWLVVAELYWRGRK